MGKRKIKTRTHNAQHVIIIVFHQAYKPTNHRAGPGGLGLRIMRTPNLRNAFFPIKPTVNQKYNRAQRERYSVVGRHAVLEEEQEEEGVYSI